MRLFRLGVRLASLGVLLSLLACNSIPEGFTTEAWERLKRDNPNRAQVVKWVDGKPELKRAKKLLIQAWEVVYPGIGDGELRNSINPIFYDAAEREMLEGLSGMTVKAIGAGLENMALRQQAKGTEEAIRKANEVRRIASEISGGPFSMQTSPPGQQPAKAPSGEPIRAQITPTPVTISSEPKMSAWFLRATFSAIHTSVRGIPVATIHPNWEFASELMKESIPQQDLFVDGKDDMKASGTDFSIEGDFDRSGVPQVALVGVFKSTRTGAGSFLMITKKAPDGPRVTFLHVIPKYTGFLCLSLQKGQLILSQCYNCGSYVPVLWDAAAGKFVLGKEE